MGENTKCGPITTVTGRYNTALSDTGSTNCVPSEFNFRADVTSMTRRERLNCHIWWPILMTGALGNCHRDRVTCCVVTGLSLLEGRLVHIIENYNYALFCSSFRRRGTLCCADCNFHTYIYTMQKGRKWNSREASLAASQSITNTISTLTTTLVITHNTGNAIRNKCIF
jgi:hypothetical protein